jgi:hypothetical protein
VIGVFILEVKAMTQTTTAVNACDVILRIDNAAGVLQNISGSSNQCSMDISRNVAETYTFDGDWALKKSCKGAVSVSIQVVYSTTADEGRDLLEDWIFDSPTDSRTVQINVPDSSAGSVRYQGDFVIESYGVPLSAEDAGVIICSASLSNDGAFSRTTIAT